ncbi:uncharacterized protein LOC123300253 [Chrysoperla carnea]|uniref:uncharacterized protein LOC123300253 n=1 Tax=Chrysoperla carnea TaxID=189513 RepID=UPI001D07FC7B|nr:uncharacterized protein LOC123300253 [Chrysoperla carnea]
MPFTTNDNGYYKKIRLNFIVITICLCIIGNVNGHGRLIEPPSRASAWRYGFNTPANYNDHELYCGGFTRQWQRNNGQCGVCGDAWDAPAPRAHEYGGRYGLGVLVRRYEVGATMIIKVEVTANHNGYFEFRICPEFKNTTQECLDKYLLGLAEPQENVTPHPYRYYPNNGNRIYEMKYHLPNISCDHCVLQWRYIAGNNWGKCDDGTERVGCGPQEEFRACADIQIGGKVDTSTVIPKRRPIFPMRPTIKPTRPTTTTSSTEDELPGATDESQGEFTDRIWLSFLIILVTLFCVLILVTILYLYYYHGQTLKNWLKSNTKFNKKPAPLPVQPEKPPRTKKLQREQSSQLPNPDLLSESLA